MIELGEKDIRVVGNGRFFRKWRWRMAASLVPFVVGWGISWVLLVEQGSYLPEGAAILWIVGLTAVVFAPAVYWDRRQRHEVNNFVLEWKSQSLRHN